MMLDVSRHPPLWTAVPLLTLLGKNWNQAVQAADGTTIAKMKVMEPESALMHDEPSPLISTLCAWRNDNADRFLDARRVTPQSTLRWLRGLTESPDRLLFLTYNNEGRPVAQYGLRRLSDDVVELDNGILGVRGEHPDLFYRIQLWILELCRESLGFVEARAQVVADNIPALFLHKRCGLKKIALVEDPKTIGRQIILLGVHLMDIKTS